ncbi:pentatricopeptide repeat-containing protein At2g20540 [Cryptomeria japonica]|uniref:pentatricopeptide repeat-containing protein At2g20540 n=1 Tax=Cryptomeria japonica TaxID=3369 RepID=UPI0027DAA191|nr:pentatricopeptide repeat-containing protein At2g20540 [Cryptomeria japonica]XP_057836383.2 pentatricopeptide repeat-containing protein At2g20540 [Cryptomeria japonica]
MQRMVYNNGQNVFFAKTLKTSMSMKSKSLTQAADAAAFELQDGDEVNDIDMSSMHKEMRLKDEVSSTIISVNFDACASHLKVCANEKATRKGKQVHAHMLKCGVEINHNVFLAANLVNMYANSGSVLDARKVFDGMSNPSTFARNAIIRGLVTHGNCEEGLIFYYQTEARGLLPDKFTFPFVIKACSSLQALRHGKEIHNRIIKVGLDVDLFVGSALVDMYSKCGIMTSARQLFDKMPQRDVVLWTALVAGYAQNGSCDEAMMLFCQMEDKNLKPNTITWNAIIAGYAQHGPYGEVLNQLRQMQLAGMTPDMVTVVSVLPACAHLAALQKGREIHDYIIRRGFEADVFVMSALIDMYAKCGIIKIARHLFDKMERRDVVSWNAMIVAYGMHGHCEDALLLFNQMQQQQIKPTHVTFVSVLSACSHAGLVDEGFKWFNCMIRDYNITPGLEHYACMVDLLGRAGRLDEAHEFIKNMPIEPGIDLWGALLGASRIHGNVELGESAAEHIFQLDSDDAGYYVMLSNIYAEAGRWDGVAKVRLLLKGRRLKKRPGCSWIEVNNRVQEFCLLTRMRRKLFMVTVRDFALLLGLQEDALECSLDHQKLLFL